MRKTETPKKTQKSSLTKELAIFAFSQTRKLITAQKTKHHENLVSPAKRSKNETSKNHLKTRLEAINHMRTIINYTATLIVCTPLQNLIKRVQKYAQ